MKKISLTPEFKKRILEAAKDSPVSGRMLRNIFPEVFSHNLVGIGGITYAIIKVGKKFWKDDGGFSRNIYMFCQVGDGMFALVHLKSGNRWTGASPFIFLPDSTNTGFLVPVLSPIWGLFSTYYDWQVVG